MKTPLFLIAASLFIISCNVSASNIFGKKTPHEKHADKMDDKEFADSPEARQWLEASKQSLSQPQQIKIPFSLHGHFPADKPRALGLRFNAKRGELITLTLAKSVDKDLTIYTDLYEDNGDVPIHITAFETPGPEYSFTVERSGSYILRLQPALNNTGEYRLSVGSGPSLGFPVSGTKARVGSVWGDSRDGGTRSHEGIDIFAPKLTPVIAAADGYITRVREEGLGGKTVSLRPAGMNISLYYAHLDKQLVQEGQEIKKGDVIGLVGNTGNAKYTPAHLHFGIYSYGGAVDPLPYVDRTKKTAPSIPVKEPTGSLKLVKAQKTNAGDLIRANTVLLPLAVSASGYLAELPGGQVMQVPFSFAKRVAPDSALAINDTTGKKRS